MDGAIRQAPRKRVITMTTTFKMEKVLLSHLLVLCCSLSLLVVSAAEERDNHNDLRRQRRLPESYQEKKKMMMNKTPKAPKCPATAESVECPAAFPQIVRFASFNVAMNRNNEGDLATELQGDPAAATQPAVIAETIQRVRPAVVLLNEFDYDADSAGLMAFMDNFLAVSQNGATPITYDYMYAAPSNTGIPSGVDLDNDGTTDGPNDAYGFGFFPGQYGMALLSMYPIDMHHVRTFQTFLWKDMPCALLPMNEDGSSYYSDEALSVFRLSSKSHWDVPIMVNDYETVHILASHPTPPVFDGPEDRNGKRNHDEIRFWADYVTGGKTAAYIYDDNGYKGGLYKDAKFVIAGDLNSDPYDGDSVPGSAQLLLDHPLTYKGTAPYSLGAVEQAVVQGQANDDHCADPRYDTAAFNPAGPGNLRADYCLPSANMDIAMAAVYWPEASDPLFDRLVGTFPFPGSDHRMVYVDAVF